MKEQDVLERLIVCEECGWHGSAGEMIASDRLRCPRCKSDKVGYHIAERSEKLQ